MKQAATNPNLPVDGQKPICRPRRWPVVLAVVAVSCLGLVASRCLSPPSAQAFQAREQESFVPGLVARFHDASTPDPRRFTTVEPRVALFLRQGESVHPRLAAGPLTARWQGYLRILRPGDYRFSTTLLGRVTVTLNGRQMLSAEVSGSKAERRRGSPVHLDAGDWPIVVTFKKGKGAGRLQLFWESNHFHREPLPAGRLWHDQRQETTELKRDRLVERGRFLVEEHACCSCHRPANGSRSTHNLTMRKGPDLSQVGRRVRRDWLLAWLMQPQQLRRHAVMPRLFSNDPAGRTEAFAIAQYLTSLGGPIAEFHDRLKPNQRRTSLARGRRLFTTVGCIACHGDTRNPAVRQFDLKGMGSKTTVPRLAEYLRDPLRFDPSGRMPNMLLTEPEAADLARYLCQETVPLPSVAAPSERDLTTVWQRMKSGSGGRAFSGLPLKKRWIELGKRLVVEKGCTACHRIAPDRKELPTRFSTVPWQQVRRRAAKRLGCLANEPERAPAFSLSRADRDALVAFLESGEDQGPGSSAYDACRALDRFNCLACHSRDGRGGIPGELAEQLRQVANAENAEAVTPPPLTEVGTKLNPSWMQRVLTEAARARPWMGLRMPQFGQDQVGSLAVGLSARDGVDPTAVDPPPEYRAADVEVGRFLVGKKAFGCIGCHDIAGVPASGTRGPDLAAMHQRVRPSWYRRWLQQPQRMQPGTQMPTIFPNGRSTIDDVLGGSADRQADAMWTYLALGKNLPLPEGLEPPPGLVVTVHDRPVLLRTFMPDVASRAIAIGYPGQVSVAYDAATCRLAYAWSGNFVDASPVWANRGGNPARLLGPRFWHGPPGFPWAFTDNDQPPDFAAIARDPAYGATPRQNAVYTGPIRLRFRGYRLDRDGYPTFRYQVTLKNGDKAGFEERPSPRRSAAGVGVARVFRMSQPAGSVAWLHVADAQTPIRLLDADGQLSDRNRQSLPAAFVVDPSASQPTVITIRSDAPATAAVVQQNGTHRALIRWPAEDKSHAITVTVTCWRAFRNETEVIRRLVLDDASNRASP